MDKLPLNDVPMPKWQLKVLNGLKNKRSFGNLSCYQNFFTFTL